MSDSFPNQVPIQYLNRDQILALASTACNEVFSTLGPGEALSAREVAQAIDRSPASVSEQMAKLVEVGLVIPAGTRKRRSRTETVYVHRGLITRFLLKDQPPDVLEAYQRRFSGQMRLAERQFESFLTAMQHDPTFQDFLIYKTYHAQLSRESALRIQLAVADLLDLIRGLDSTPSNAPAGEDVVRLSFSCTLMPTQQESLRRAKKT